MNMHCHIVWNMALLLLCSVHSTTAYTLNIANHPKQILHVDIPLVPNVGIPGSSASRVHRHPGVWQS